MNVVLIDEKNRFVITLYNFVKYVPAYVRVVKLRRMRWVRHVARMGEDRCVHRVLVGNPEGKRPLVRPRRRWEDNNNPLMTKLYLSDLKTQLVPCSKHSALFVNTDNLKLHSEIIAVCS